MPKVIHFEIPAADTERALKFYIKVFGWKFDQYPGPMNYWLAKAGEDKETGINGAITQKGDVVNVTTNTISVPSYEVAIKKIIEAGGKVLSEKTVVPTIGYMSYCQDTEGNVFGIMQIDSDAK